MAAAALDRIVRGGRSEYRGGYDSPEGPEKSLLNWLDRLDREGELWRNAADQEIWRKDAESYLGRRYITHAPKFSANVIRPVVDRRNALLTENKPNVKILPWRDGLTAVSNILEQLFDADWHASSMQLALEEMVQLASIFGSAGLDTPWNPSAHFGQGAFDPVVLDPRQVGFDPLVRRARYLDKAQYIWIETVKNIWDIQREYPGRGMLVRPDRNVSTIVTATGNPNNQLLQQLSTSFHARMEKLEEGPIPRKICREYWVRDPRTKPDGKLEMPLGRNIERAGTVILEDAQNPYWDGLWPVLWFDLKSDIDSLWGRSEVESLRYIANAINRIGDMFVDNAILGGNLVVVADADAITNETRNRLTNAAALIIPKKFGRSLEFRPPPQMPPHMLGFVQWALSFIDYLCGLQDAGMQGKGRVEMRSGIQLEGLQNAAQTLIKASARRLEDFLERFGQKWMARIFQFATGKRLYYMLGQNDEYKQWTFNYGELQTEFQNILKQDSQPTDKADALREMMRTAWMQFAFKISPLSSLASNKIARAQMLAQLAETGRFPFGEVLRNLGYENGKDLQAQAAQEAAQYGPPQPTKGSKKK